MGEKINLSPGVLQSVWRFLASLKLTVVLLLCLALLSIVGTVIPQNLSMQTYIAKYGLFGYQLFALLDIVDMYHSWWFVGLLLMLVINIVVCSIDRLETTWRVIFPKTRNFDLAAYQRRKSRLDFQIARSAADINAIYQRFLSKRFRYHRLETMDSGFAIVAERGRWTRMGVYIVHLSVVVMLLGGLIGSRFGFEGFVKIAEGESADAVVLNRSGQNFTLPFSIRCDDFDVQFYKGTQRPKEFRSRLSLVQDGREVVTKEIVVNDPLRYNGIGIYQSSYEPIDDGHPTLSADIDPEGTFALSIRSVESGLEYTRNAAIGEAINMPEGLGTLVLKRFDPQAQFREMALGPALVGELTDRENNSLTITLPLQFPRFDAMRRGVMVISVSTPVTAPQPPRYFTGLQVVYDPGVGVVYLGFVLMIAGCLVTFFMSHQQVVVIIRTQKKGVAVTVSGKANKNKVGFVMKLQRMAGHLEQLGNKS